MNCYCNMGTCMFRPVAKGCGGVMHHPFPNLPKGQNEPKSGVCRKVKGGGDVQNVNFWGKKRSTFGGFHTSPKSILAKGLCMLRGLGGGGGGWGVGGMGA